MNNQNLYSADPVPSGHSTLADQSTSIFDLGAILRTIVARRVIVLTTLIVGILLGLFLASKPKKYAAMGTLRIQPSGNQPVSIQATPFSGGDSDSTLNSEVLLLQSRTLAIKVARELNLERNEAFWGTSDYHHGTLDDPKMRDLVVLRMQKIVVITRIPKSQIVQITCTTSSPLLSAQIVNNLVNEYISYIFQLRYGSTERVSKWLVSQLDDLKKQVENDQVELVSLQEKLGVLALDPKGGDYLIADSLGGLTRAENDATINRIVAEARYRYLQDSNPNLIENEQPVMPSPGSAQTSLLENLRGLAAEAEAQYAELSARLGPNYPDVKVAKARLDSLNKEIKTEQDRILNQAKVAYSAASANENMTSKVLHDRKNAAFGSHDDMVRYLTLEREYESHRTLYAALVQHLRLAGINAGLDSAQVDVVDVADIPSIPIKPLPWQLFVVTVVGMLIVGCVIAFLVDYFDDLLDTQEEITLYTGLSPLAMLPTFNIREQTSTFSELTRPHSPYAEEMQLLRNSILLAGGPHLKSIAVTSTIPGEGKSTAARNLAALLALHGMRALLIDTDLHKPMVHTSLKTRRSPGLSEILMGTATLRDSVISSSEMENLYILPAGRKVQQPATLLSSSVMKALLLEAEASFDLVILDMPPVLSVSDPVLCAPLVDLCVVIIRQHMVGRRDEQQAINLLQRGGATIAGFVLNATSDRWGKYSDYRGYYGNYGADDNEASA